MRFFISLTLLLVLLFHHEASAMEQSSTPTSHKKKPPTLEDVRTLIENATTQGMVAARNEIIKLYYKGLYRKLFKPKEIGFEGWSGICDQSHEYDYYVLHEFDTEEITTKFPKFFKSIQTRVENSDIQAKNNLGYMYFKGIGVEKNLDLALSCFKYTADKGDPKGQYNLGYMYEHGLEEERRDFDKAIHLYILAAEQGDPLAQFALGEMYQSGHGRTDTEDGDVGAVAQYRLAADQGFAAAQSQLALMSLHGRGGLQKSDKEAVHYAKLALAQQDSLAQALLGYLYVHGRGGLVKDPKTGFRICRLSADQGDSRGQELLELMFKKGWGVDVNHIEFFDWYLKSNKPLPKGIFFKQPLSVNTPVNGEDFQDLITEVIQEKATTHVRENGLSLSFLLERLRIKMVENQRLVLLYQAIIEQVQEVMNMMRGLQKAKEGFMMTTIELTDECQRLLSKREKSHFFARHVIEGVPYFTLEEDNVVLANQYVEFLEGIDNKFLQIYQKLNTIPFALQKHVSEASMMPDLSSSPSLATANLLYVIDDSPKYPSVLQNRRVVKKQKFISFTDEYNCAFRENPQFELENTSEEPIQTDLLSSSNLDIDSFSNDLDDSRGSTLSQEVVEEHEMLRHIEQKIKALLPRGAHSRNKDALTRYPGLGD